jgi:hypothetical protein
VAGFFSFPTDTGIMRVAALHMVARISLPAVTLCAAQASQRFLQKFDENVTDVAALGDPAPLRQLMEACPVCPSQTPKTYKGICRNQCAGYEVPDTDRPLRDVIYCTPFPFWQTSAVNAGVDGMKECNGFPLDHGGALNGKAWFNEGYPEGGTFVFHQCDGAGIQSDCIGGKYYVEQYPYEYEHPYPAWEDYTCRCTVDGDGNVVAPAAERPQDTNYFIPCRQDGNEWVSDEFHTNCQFTHPGSWLTFPGMRTGQWTTDAQPFDDYMKSKSTLTANIECSKYPDSCVCDDWTGDDQHREPTCLMDYSVYNDEYGCNLERGVWPTWPENQLQGVTRFYWRTEPWVCHWQEGNPNPDEKWSSGSQYINCLSDNEPQIYPDYGNPASNGYVIPSPNQEIYYAALQSEEPDADGNLVMTVQRYNFCAVPQGSEYEMRLCKQGDDENGNCMGIY